MRNILNSTIAILLAAGPVLAQKTSGSVESILEELKGSQEKTTAAAPANLSEPAVATAKVSVAEAAAGSTEKIDVDAVMEESREHYVASEFAEAQQGFEQVVRINPGNTLAQMYLQQLLERDHRKAEVDGMKAIDAAWSADPVLRSYALVSDAVEKMELKNAVSAMDVESLFPQIKFPEGTSAVYDPDSNALYVRNTRENLAALESILDAMELVKSSASVNQVEIESKFVEVSEGTLEELGFEWHSAGGQNIGLGGKWSANGSYFLFDDALRGGASGPDMPFSRPNSLLAGEDPADAPGWSASRLEDGFNTDPANVTLQFRGGTPLDVVISALDQTSGTDVLSAPRVVTQNGKKAVIRVGQLHRYPARYKVGASEGNIVHVSYDDFEEKLLGVELEVTPEVNGDQINLALHPQVTELLGWQRYNIAPANSAYTYFQYRIGFEFEHDEIVARLPVFKTREIKTEVTVADGGTIGMGGLISEKVESFKDKVPVLGSIPLIGRLFRNEGERAVKRNLLMFVTAKKVEPTGRVNTARSFE